MIDIKLTFKNTEYRIVKRGEEGYVLTKSKNGKEKSSRSYFSTLQSAISQLPEHMLPSASIKTLEDIQKTMVEIKKLIASAFQP